MNLIKAVLLKIAAFLFAVMTVLVRYLGEAYPVGQVVFFRSAFAILPVVIIYAWRGELEAAIRMGRPFGHIGRGLTAVGAMFCNFSALARLPVVDATAISFVVAAVHGGDVGADPQGARAHLSLVGGNRRASGVLVMLAPHLDVGRATAADAARDRGHAGACRRLLRGRLDHPDPRADQERDDVVDRVLFLADMRARRGS